MAETQEQPTEQFIDADGNPIRERTLYGDAYGNIIFIDKIPTSSPLRIQGFHRDSKKPNLRIWR